MARSIAYFNGAALFQVRKACKARAPNKSRMFPSMGPHSFKCGKRSEEGKGTCREEPSMGPHSFKCGKQDWKYPDAPRFYSFNGAALFQVRKAGARLCCWEIDKPPSMGPHSFKCGKWNWRVWALARAATFNGAALFQVRKAGKLPQAQESLLSLQWGRTLSSAERYETDIKQRKRFVPSMGPHSFKCGKCPSAHSPYRQSCPSMGPHSFKCGKHGVIRIV